MGRPRGFTEDAVLKSAAQAFTDGGYEGTSIDDLVKALNLHRGSLYKAFGSKRGLFLAVLGHYVGSHLAKLTQAVRGGGGSSVVEVLTRGPDLDLLLIAAVERGHKDAEVAALVRRALELLESAADEAVPPRPSERTPGPALAIELLGARLYRRLHDESNVPPRHTTKEM